MYFVYFTVFVLLVFVPILVPVVLGSSSIGSEEAYEMTLILLLGTIGFMIYLWQEKRFRLNFRKRVSVQRESHQIFKDLGEAYAYIGEVNRMFDILKRIPGRMVDSLEKKGRVAYAPFFEALALIGRSGKITIQFIATDTRQILGEVKTDRKMPVEIGINNAALIEKNENFFETERYFVAKSPRSMENVIGVVIIQRLVSTHRIEDPEMMKALASLALHFFILNGKKVRN